MSTVNVSASAMNLAGPIESRPNYLKTIIASQMVTGGTESISSLLQRSYAHGPGASMKGFYRWARNMDNYGFIGRTLSFHDDPDPSGPPIPATGAEREHMYLGAVGPAIYSYWANQRYMNEHLESFGEQSKPWKASFDSVSGQITLTAPGRFVDTFTPVGYDPNGRYLYTTLDIYRLGSGNAAQEAIAAQVQVEDSGYFPFVPLRTNNIMVSESCPEAYAQATKALKKACGIDIDEITTKLAEHEDIGEMDGAHIVFGVGVNTQDTASKKYIYEFYRWLSYKQFRYQGDLDSFTAAANAHAASVEAYRTWLANGSVGTAPTISAAPSTPRGQNNIQSFGAVPGGPSVNFSVSILYRYLREEMGTGLKKPDAQVGDLWWEVIPMADGQSTIEFAGGQTYANGKYGTECRLHWQIAPDLWKTMVIGGGLYRNNVFGTNYKETLLGEAVVASEDTLFILPLNTFVLTNVGMVNAAQIVTQCYHIVVGAFKVITKSILGSFIIFVIMIIVMVVFPPLNIGILGAGATVGAALGFTAIGAAIIGALVNTIAAMIVMKVIQKASILIFGEKLGQIIGAIVGFVAITVGAGLASGQSFSTAFGSLLQIDKLMALTNAVGGGVAGYLSAATQEVYSDMQKMQESYAAGMKTVQDLYAQNIGYDMGTINPLGLTDVNFGVLTETPQSFLDRTLMTGSDLAQLSMDLLENFADITTRVALPGQA